MFARLRLLLVVLAAAATGSCPREALAGARPELGANVDLVALEPKDRAAALDRLAAAGVVTVRMELDWDRVEPRPGAFTWARYDAALAAARARNMEVVLVLGPCASWAVDPAWQVPPEQRRSSLPRLPQLWQGYVSAAVRHFRGQVRHWQIREQPNARNFRGARAEYLQLLDLAAREIRALDPGARIIAPEPGFLDLASLDRLLDSASSSSADIVGLYLPAEPSRAMLPWAVLSQEILGQSEGRRRKPVWILGVQDGETTSHAALYLLAWAFGAERCFLPAEAIAEDWAKPLLGLAYAGFATPAPGAWMLFFVGPRGSLAAAWSEREVICQPPREASSGTGQGGTAPSEEPAAPALQLGPRPTLLPADRWLPAMRPGSPTRADVLAARGCPDMSALPMVYADYSMPGQAEFGLANRPLRSLGGGACIEEPWQGRNCVRTHMTYREEEKEEDVPWLYFDVDDSWMYFDRGKSRVVITIECGGSYAGPEKLGFNIVYDSTTGYRFSPWQWVEPGYGWRSYRVELNNVSFANRDGWDFRINAKGSIQDLWVTAVTVEKLPPTEGPAQPPPDRPAARAAE